MRQEQVLDGRYRLTEHLGVGGMSVVWKAHDELLSRSVAVKVLAGPAASPAARQRIRAEARAAAQLWHPNVTDVYDYGESRTESDECVAYVVMELLPGCTLAERLAAGPLPPRSGLRICAEVAGALAAAHATGLVHRDVKPSNVMLTPTGSKVLDFGLAAVAGDPETDEDGELHGTPAYFAPERLAGGEVIPASDVYALGLLIHRALTNQLPWQAETTTQMLNAHAYVEPAPLPPVDGIPQEVYDACRRCLAKDPADRPSASEVAAILADAAGVVPIPRDDRPLAAVAPIVDGAEATRAVKRDGRWRVVPLVAVGAALATIAAVEVLDQHDARRGDGIVAVPSVAPSSTPSASARPAVSAGNRPTARTAEPIRPTTGTPKRSRRPSTSPTRVLSSPAALPGQPVSAYGGTVRVRCDGRKAEILRLDPTPGYTVKDYEPGPADQVKAVLESPVNKSEIVVKCDKGAPAASVKETPL